MKDAQPRAIFLKDYREPDYWIRNTELDFELEEVATTVTARLTISRNPKASPGASLVLHGQELELLSLRLNDKALEAGDYQLDAETLTLDGLKADNTLECVTRIKPQDNTSLEGLYRSGNMYCTQCEAEGFRKITYYLDRPDVMSEFTTRIVANKKHFPVLLSNGNLIDSGDLSGGRHFATWHDPFKKPSYLFALVAGDLACVDDGFTTTSGRQVAIKVFVEEKDLDKCGHAIRSLKNAMKWDEETYGREYDLDIFMIVAVDDFNMGAMENKGLNIFNTSCVLAKEETTTDDGFQRVEGVVAHEYFHNWSGNRVTCRDWFQLSLKEGFTVFRDQQFSAAMGSPTVKRVEDVSLLRTMQFAEDAGPMAHPVQPDSFIEISNFYTLTVYEKGAEIVRMLHTLLGEEGFRQGTDLYFARHDGQAVTIEDFVAAMAEVSGRDFDQFMRWYKTAGTPVLNVGGHYDAVQRRYTLSVQQQLDEQGNPFHIPLAVGLIGEKGELPLQLEEESTGSTSQTTAHRVLEVCQQQQEFVFVEVDEPPVPSLLRGFSAPVKLRYPYTRDELMKLMSRDGDGFCRWDASQQLATSVIQEVMAALKNEPSPAVDERLVQAYGEILRDDSLDPAMVALMLALPSENYLAELETVVDVESIHHARKRVARKIAQLLKEDFQRVYDRLSAAGEAGISSTAIAKRSLKNKALHYLMLAPGDQAVALCEQQFRAAANMSDELAAFSSLVHSSKTSVVRLKERVIMDFYKKWKNETLVVNHWFQVQASDPNPDGLTRVRSLMKHASFDLNNPNKMRSVVGTYCMRNPINFHLKNGAGYAFLAEQVIGLDHRNPQIAARLLTPLTKWRRYDELRQELMRKQLERIASQAKLSKDVYEVVSKSLQN